MCVACYGPAAARPFDGRFQGVAPCLAFRPPQQPDAADDCLSRSPAAQSGSIRGCGTASCICGSASTCLSLQTRGYRGQSPAQRTRCVVTARKLVLCCFGLAHYQGMHLHAQHSSAQEGHLSVKAVYLWVCVHVDALALNVTHHQELI